MKSAKLATFKFPAWELEKEQSVMWKGTESMNDSKKAIDMPPEELECWLHSLEMEEPVGEYTFRNPDPYAKSYDQRKHDFSFDKDGSICVKNISAYWIPELTITEEIGGTIYTVTGTYEGETSFLHKLERIMARKFVKEMEEGNDTLPDL